MQLPTQISYRQTTTSEALSSVIHEKVAELERIYERIIGCRVFVQSPGAHHRRGQGAHFRVRIELSVPSETLLVTRNPVVTESEESALYAVNEAFHAMRRQLQDYVRRRWTQAKPHVGPPHGRVTRLHPEEGYGFLETSDGTEVYFNRASVLNAAFDRLEIGSEVRFAEEQGDHGPQASTVTRLGVEGHHVLRRASASTPR